MPKTGDGALVSSQAGHCSMPARHGGRTKKRLSRGGRRGSRKVGGGEGFQRVVKEKVETGE